MKESVRIISTTFDMINRETGEILPVDGVVRNQQKYYSIQKITTGVNNMEYLEALAYTVKDKKLPIISLLLDTVTADNELIIMNQTKLAKELECSLNTLKRILTGFVGSGFAIKIDTGRYRINPFIYMGRRTRSSEAREQLQVDWRILIAEQK